MKEYIFNLGNQFKNLDIVLGMIGNRRELISKRERRIRRGVLGSEIPCRVLQVRLQCTYMG
jgi:hypothetical protein